jgi:Protein of unknown function (DUF1559)
MSFRLWTIFYVFALFAAAMATFGAAGIIAACTVLAFWGWVYRGPKLQTSVAILLLIIGVVAFLAALLLPALSSVRSYSRRAACFNQIHQLGLALNSYYARTGSYPPVHVANADGTPLLSWRVLILSKLERQDAFDLIDFSAAWDDPRNRPVTSTPIDLFRCPSYPREGPTTNYLAVVGPQAAWLPSGTRTLADFHNGGATTILLVEADDKQVPWAQPKDLTFDEAVELLTSPPGQDAGHHVRHGFFYKPTVVRHVVFADGHVGFVRVPLDRDVAEALLKVGSDTNVDPLELRRATEPELDYALSYAFGMFVFLALLPAAWVKWGGIRGRHSELSDIREPEVVAADDAKARPASAI